MVDKQWDREDVSVVDRDDGEDERGEVDTVGFGFKDPDKERRLFGLDARGARFTNGHKKGRDVRNMSANQRDQPMKFKFYVRYALDQT